MATQSGILELEEALDSFGAAERRAALGRLLQDGAADLPPVGTNVNMHCHSFFSYNGEGYSPSRIAWESRKAGLYAAGLCDFDVLDGLEEFLEAGRMLSLRTTVNLETRAFFPEYSDVDISSPGEPGVTYIMGAGFAARLADGTPPADGLAGYRERARTRNEALIDRINPHVPDIGIDYERDVLPLTPAGGATERHIVSAYVNRSISVFEHPDVAADFWARILEKDIEETTSLLADRPTFEELVRARLVKRGGLGYEQPSESTFPPVADFIQWVLSCDAVPMVTWLDGSSDGEKDGRAMLECMREKGAAALNIVPDRNWNTSDPEQRDKKRANLEAIVEAAVALDLPINIGTEMNKLGLPFVDDLDGEVLAAYRAPFVSGACIMVGHSVLLRYAAFSYTGAAAASEFKDTKARNDFFEAVGKLPALTTDRAAALEDMGTDKALSWFREQVRA